MATLTSFKNSTKYVVVGGNAEVSWSTQGLAIMLSQLLGVK